MGFLRTSSIAGKKQALEGFPRLFEEERKAEQAKEAEHERQLSELYAGIG